MYDFHEAERRARAGPARADRALRESYGAPHPLLTLAEMPRLSVEYASSCLLDLVTPRRDEGRGRPVLVLPGFYATDGLTGRLRGHLAGLGYDPHPWGLGRNVGLTDRIVTGLLDRLDEVHDASDGAAPVSLVGWSFGGLLARWLAHQRPGSVRQVVCLGSPWRAEGERTRATGMFERARVRHGITDRAAEIVAELRGPVPVPLTAVWSRTDGIAHWRGCRVDDGPLVENVEVPSSHVGLVSNPLSLAVLADRLAQDPADWQPFDWSTCLRGRILGRTPAPDRAGTAG